ncbi:PspC domain-containing protein [Parasphingorhabdus pacifica]
MMENATQHTDPAGRTDRTHATDHVNEHAGFENGTDRNTTVGAGAQANIRKLRRSHSGRMLGGVCSGGAEFLGVDAALLRILLIAATLLGFGLGIVLYIACWIVVPEED